MRALDLDMIRWAANARTGDVVPSEFLKQFSQASPMQQVCYRLADLGVTERREGEAIDGNRVAADCQRWLEERDAPEA